MMPDSLNIQSDRYDFQSPVSAPPKRVISLVPSLTESLFDLDLGDRLVAVTDYCVHPQTEVMALSKIGGTKTPDIEQIIALKPDLVLMNKEENRQQDAETLINAGIPVWATHPKSVLDAINLLWQVMYVFDHTTMVERVRLIERQYDWALSAAKSTPAVRVFAPIWYSPWMTITKNTYIHNILEVCGGENVFADYRQRDSDAAGTATANPYPRVTIEDIVIAQPEVILLPDEPYPFTEKQVQELSALEIPAARQNRIHLVDGTLLSWHGTRIAQALTVLPPLLAGS